MAPTFFRYLDVCTCDDSTLHRITFFTIPDSMSVCTHVCSDPAPKSPTTDLTAPLDRRQGMRRASGGDVNRCPSPDSQIFSTPSLALPVVGTSKIRSSQRSEEIEMEVDVQF
nr:hypothetical protein CFP56_63772 [Quercus suber]